MTLHIYNTLTGEIEEFKPINEKRVTMYVCGPTVYNRVHIGNARPAVVFDTLARLLRTLYPQLVYARNITDIDDKIIKAAAEQNENVKDLSKRFAEAYLEDMAALNNTPPDIIPCATDHIPEMLSMVERLIEKGHAYEAEGHVLFDVRSMEKYGELSGRALEDMLAGARVEVAPYKKYPGDFILWKPSVDGEPSWPSPWGDGRPGWHLECSAMVEKHLGETIDIHGGGQDLIFPHHENEIAQSCCAHDGKKFVNYWMHNGFINIDGEKMSKSLGNFRLVCDLLDHYQGEVLRFALLYSNYRSEMNFDRELLGEAKKNLDKLYRILLQTKDIKPTKSNFKLSKQPVYKALLNDLNTRQAIRELLTLAKGLKQYKGRKLSNRKMLLLDLADLLGLLKSDPDEWFKDKRRGTVIEAKTDRLKITTFPATITLSYSDEKIEELINERADAKKQRDFARADQIRDELAAQGVVLEDSREGTSWRRE